MADGPATPPYPVYLDLGGRLCVVVGEGDRAERKARALQEAGGDVAVIGASPSEALLQASADGELTVEQRGYVRGDLEGAFLVVCVGGSQEVGRAVAAEARERGCLVNVAGAPDLCDFTMPSVLRRGGLQVAVSTGGAAPQVARQACARISESLGEEWAAYVALMGDLRALVLAKHTDAARRRDLLSRAAGSAVLERLAAGEKLTAKKLLRELEAETGDPARDVES